MGEILTRGIGRKMGGMAFVVKLDKAFDGAEVGVFGMNAEVFEAYGLADSFEEGLKAGHGEPFISGSGSCG